MVVVVGELHVTVTTSKATEKNSKVAVGSPTVAVEAFKVAGEEADRGTQIPGRHAMTSQQGLATVAPTASLSTKQELGR